MYRNLLAVLREYAGDWAEWIVGIGLAVLAVALILKMLPAWRRSVRQARTGAGWRAVLLAIADGLLSVVVAATIVALLGAAMLHQSREFSNRYGRVTEANSYAIRTSWGPPHEQRELAVTHYVTREESVLVFPDGREIVEEEGTTSEVPAGENAPTRIKRKVREAVAQNSIVRGRVDLDVRMNYRFKGAAYYTCYDDAWQFAYTVRNRSDQETEAVFRFPLPADQGALHDFLITVDGEDWAEHVVLVDGAQSWTMPMAPGAEVEVAVRYASRGTQFVRYTPAYMARRDQYQFVMRIFPDPDRGPSRLVWERDMKLPIGCMTPTKITDAPAPGEPMVLDWDLARVATTFGMGAILPDAPQPGQFAVRLLHEAAWGVALLAGMLVVTWLMLGRGGFLLELALVLGAYYLFYTLTATFSEHLPVFWAGFAVAAALATAVAALVLWGGWGDAYAATQSVGLFVLMVVYYPVAVILEDYTGVLLQVLYWVLVAYVAGLAVARLWRARRAPANE